MLVLAFIGFISSCIYIYRFCTAQLEIKAYSKNCDKVEIGMSVQRAKEIMGDYKWYTKQVRSEIWIEEIKTDSSVRFYLSYPATFGSSDWPMIYFNPKTMVVTEVRCGE